MAKKKKTKKKVAKKKVTKKKTRSLSAQSCSILEMSNSDAQKFLLKQESYFTFDLPPYFHFTKLLKKISKVLKEETFSELSRSPRDYDDVNHLIMANKDGKYAWRPFELIHPALYVSLVKKITEEETWSLIQERFKEFSDNENIKCLSIPRESQTKEKDKASQISHWWQEVEQESIILALDYNYLIHTDVTDCYGSIYTHSIAWALHTKEVAKNNRSDKKLIGNIIDWRIQDMRHGQTNGIPQGSVLMDLIAEMVLGYADTELTKKIEKLEIEDYKILRYRDDCRIFVNNSQDGEQILKCLTEVMINLGLKLHHEKTKASNDVILASIKEDKRSWIGRKQGEKGLQNHLFLIHKHGIDYPNSGTLVKALSRFYKRIIRLAKCNQPLPLISIVTDIAFYNPRTYPISAAILSKLLSFLKNREKKPVIGKIQKKFSLIPNTGYMQIWLQRITLPFAPDIDFGEPLCCLVSGGDQQIWNNEWISSRNLKRALDAKVIIKEKENLNPIVSVKEVELFLAKLEYE